MDSWLKKKRQSFSSVGGSSGSRKRPLSNGNVSASMSKTQNKFGSRSVTDCDGDEVSPESYAQTVSNKNWHDSMTAEIKALKSWLMACRQNTARNETY